VKTRQKGVRPWNGCGQHVPAIGWSAALNKFPADLPARILNESPINPSPTRKKYRQNSRKKMLSARVRFFLVVVGGVAPSGASAGRKEGDGGVSAACAVTMTSLGVVMVVDIVFRVYRSNECVT